VEHHAAGLGRLATASRGSEFARAVKWDYRNAALTPREQALLTYAVRLNDDPGTMQASDIEDMRKEGITDAEILHANLVVGYFAFANRLTLGLGVQLESKDHALGE